MEPFSDGGEPAGSLPPNATSASGDDAAGLSTSPPPTQQHSSPGASVPQTEHDDTAALDAPAAHAKLPPEVQGTPPASTRRPAPRPPPYTPQPPRTSAPAQFTPHIPHYQSDLAPITSALRPPAVRRGTPRLPSTRMSDTSHGSSVFPPNVCLDVNVVVNMATRNTTNTYTSPQRSTTDAPVVGGKGWASGLAGSSGEAAPQFQEATPTGSRVSNDSVTSARARRLVDVISPAQTPQSSRIPDTADVSAHQSKQHAPATGRSLPRTSTNQLPYTTSSYPRSRSISLTHPPRHPHHDSPPPPHWSSWGSPPHPAPTWRAGAGILRGAHSVHQYSPASALGYSDASGSVLAGRRRARAPRVRAYSGLSAGGGGGGEEVVYDKGEDYDSLWSEGRLQELVSQCVPLQHGGLYKGSCGKLLVIGGCASYTGAPFFAASGGLKVGCDLMHVLCSKQAGHVIKCYSPELMVHPLIVEQNELEQSALHNHSNNDHYGADSNNNNVKHKQGEPGQLAPNESTQSCSKSQLGFDGEQVTSLPRSVLSTSLKALHATVAGLPDVNNESSQLVTTSTTNDPDATNQADQSHSADPAYHAQHADPAQQSQHTDPAHEVQNADPDNPTAPPSIPLPYSFPAPHAQGDHVPITCTARHNPTTGMYTINYSVSLPAPTGTEGGGAPTGPATGPAATPPTGADDISPPKPRVKHARLCQALISKIKGWVARIDCVVIGPGLGSEDDVVWEQTAEIIRYLRSLSIPLVLDADALRLVAAQPELIKGYNKVVLTPNVNEMTYLAAACGIKVTIPQVFERRQQLTRDIGRGLLGPVVVSKGPTDMMCNPSGYVIECSTQGSVKRCGGQGDVTAGAIGVMAAWALKQHKEKPLPVDPMLLAAYGGCHVTRRAAAAAQICIGRSMMTSDLLNELPAVMEHEYGA